MDVLKLIFDHDIILFYALFNFFFYVLDGRIYAIRKRNTIRIKSLLFYVKTVFS